MDGGESTLEARGLDRQGEMPSTSTLAPPSGDGDPHEGHSTTWPATSSRVTVHLLPQLHDDEARSCERCVLREHRVSLLESLRREGRAGLDADLREVLEAGAPQALDQRLDSVEVMHGASCSHRRTCARTRCTSSSTAPATGSLRPTPNGYGATTSTAKTAVCEGNPRPRRAATAASSGSPALCRLDATTRPTSRSPISVTVPGGVRPVTIEATTIARS